MTSPTILHASWGSSCSYRVRICLNLKNVPYQVNPVKATRLGDEYRGYEVEMNPMKYIPILHIDSHVLIESLAIMQYLEETRPQPSLMPRDSYKRAQVRAICDAIASGIQPLQNTGPLHLLGKYSSKEKETEWARHWIIRGFSALEKLLLFSAGNCCVGDEITLADCCLVPQVLNARKFDIDLKPYPTISRIDNYLQKQAAFRQAHPTAQPDFPEEFKTDPKYQQP